MGRITESITMDDIRGYFNQFGQVTDVYIPKPFRSFAFVTFDNPDAAQKLIGEDHILKGVSVHVSEAAPRYSNNTRMLRAQRSNFANGGVWSAHPNKPTRSRSPPEPSNSGAVALLSALGVNPSVLAAVNQLGATLSGKNSNFGGPNKGYDYNDFDDMAKFYR